MDQDVPTPNNPFMRSKMSMRVPCVGRCMQARNAGDECGHQRAHQRHGQALGNEIERQSVRRRPAESAGREAVEAEEEGKAEHGVDGEADRRFPPDRSDGGHCPDDLCSKPCMSSQDRNCGNNPMLVVPGFPVPKP